MITVADSFGSVVSIALVIIGLLLVAEVLVVVLWWQLNSQTSDRLSDLAHRLNPTRLRERNGTNTSQQEASTTEHPAAAANASADSSQASEVTPSPLAPTPKSTPPRIPGSRLGPDGFAPLAPPLQQSIDFWGAENRIGETLLTLPTDRWTWQRYVHVHGYLFPFLLFGETGVFAIWAALGPVRWEQLHQVGSQADYLKQTLPEYPGPVHAVWCRPLHRGELPPRWWCRPDELGAWVMGLSSLLDWVESFGTENGVGVADITRLLELRRAAVPTHPVLRRPDLVPDL